MLPSRTHTNTPRFCSITQWLFGALFIFIIALLLFPRNPRLLNKIRPINKRYYNRLMLHFSGRKGIPYSIIIHKGRTSGHLYKTPIALLPTHNGFLIPTPYGTRTDWYHNILKAGTCTAQWEGKHYQLIKPEVLTHKQAKRLIKKWQYNLCSIFGIKTYIKLTTTTIEQPS